MVIIRYLQNQQKRFNFTIVNYYAVLIPIISKDYLSLIDKVIITIEYLMGCFQKVIITIIIINYYIVFIAIFNANYQDLISKSTIVNRFLNYYRKIIANVINYYVLHITIFIAIVQGLINNNMIIINGHFLYLKFKMIQFNPM